MSPFRPHMTSDRADRIINKKNQNHQLNWWYALALKGHVSGNESRRTKKAFLFAPALSVDDNAKVH